MKNLLFFLVFLLSVTTVSAQVEPTISIRESGVTVSVFDHGDVKIYAFTAPAKAAANSTYIIEGPNKLVLVDAQFMAPFAFDFRAYANSLNKPIDRIFISHAHPDHFFGLAAFKDVDVYAFAGTKAIIEKNGPDMHHHRREMMGDLIPAEFVAPGNVVEAGMMTIDGISMELVAMADAEAHEQMVIKLPAQKTLLVADLIYNDYHLIIMDPTFDSWSEVLRTIRGWEGYADVLPGHGRPANNSIYGANIEYLHEAKMAYEASGSIEDFKATLIAKYPNLQGQNFFDIYAKALYAHK